MNLKKSGLVLVLLFILEVESIMSVIAKQYFTQKFLTEIGLFLLFCIEWTQWMLGLNWFFVCYLCGVCASFLPLVCLNINGVVAGVWLEFPLSSHKSRCGEEDISLFFVLFGGCGTNCFLWIVVVYGDCFAVSPVHSGVQRADPCLAGEVWGTTVINHKKGPEGKHCSNSSDN